MPRPAKDLSAAVIKKPNTKVAMTPENEIELATCLDDPFYFIRNYVKIQHPKKGSLPFDLFPYQEKIVEGFWKHRSTVALCGRQMGKSVTFKTNVLREEDHIEVGTLIPMTWQQKVVSYLENLLLKLS